MRDDAVQPLLRAGRLGHDLDQPRSIRRGRDLALPRLRPEAPERSARRRSASRRGAAGSRRARAPAPLGPLTSSARIPAHGRMPRTRPTLWPAISEPSRRRRRSPRDAGHRPRNARSRATPPRRSSRRGGSLPMTSSWISAKRRVAALASARTGITLNSRVELHRRHGVAGAGADERLLEARVRDRFAGADEHGADLHAGRTHLADRRRSPRHGRCRRPRTPAPRSRRAGSPAPAPRSRPGRYGRPPPCPR